MGFVLGLHTHRLCKAGAWYVVILCVLSVSCGCATPLLLLFSLICGVVSHSLCVSDHVALMIELLGDMPKAVATSGKYSNEIFDRRGILCTNS